MLTKVAVAIIVLGSLASTASNREQCGDPGWLSTCTVENTGSQIDVGATITEQGSGGADERGGSGGAPVPTTPEPTAPICTPSPTDLCRGNYTTARLPDVTMADLAAFRPAPPAASSEPDGIGIAGMPTNIVATAAAHSASGTVLGYPVTVTFTPVEFRFSYGDGTTRTASTPGASWGALGQPPFTATPTSHVYAARGEYTASVTVVYTAQVDFGGGARSVPGTLELASPGAPLRIVEARTALVAYTCHERPTAPGC